MLRTPRRGRWTVVDLRELPTSGFYRYEIDERVLIVSPLSSPAHQDASRELATLVEDAIEAAQLDFGVAQAVDLVTSSRNDWLKVPDVLMVTGDAYAPGRTEYDAADVILAIEVNDTRQSRFRDFGEKVDAYAEVGIEDYWVLELKPVPKLTAFALKGGAYEQIAVSSSLIHLTRPFPVDVDPPKLLMRRPIS